MGFRPLVFNCERRDFLGVVVRFGYVNLFALTVFQKYYSYVPASRCQENEIKHICRYHSRHAAENLLQTLEQGVSVVLMFNFILFLIQDMEMSA